MSDALAGINWDEVPDRYMPVEPGEYTAVVQGEPTVEPTKDGKSEKVVVKLQIESDDESVNGRIMTDNISVKMLTRLKQFYKSAGVTPGDPLSEFEGKYVKIRVKNRTYNDPQSGEERTTDDVAAYLFED